MEERKESQVAASFDQPMPRLRTATCEDVEIYKEYKSGASYKGRVHDNKRTGRGTFTWPNGAKYEGEFEDNVRHGQGEFCF